MRCRFQTSHSSGPIQIQCTIIQMKHNFSSPTSVYLQPDLGQQLDEEGVAQAFFLSCGFMPFMKLRDLRAEDRGDLNLGCGFHVCSTQGCEACVCQ